MDAEYLLSRQSLMSESALTDLNICIEVNLYRRILSKMLHVVDDGDILQ